MLYPDAGSFQYHKAGACCNVSIINYFFEDHRACGIRELSEETGYSAENFDYLGFMYPSPGFADEVTHLYLATGLTKGENHLDPDEYLDVEFIPIDDVKKMIMDNEINDAKTVFGVFKALEVLGK